MRTFGNHYDLIILGSGISGSMLAVIMARKGYRVLIVDQGVHPKFAVGESTIPQTSQMISLLAREHQVPEIAHLGLASPEGLRKHIGHTSGIKRVFGFCYHHLDAEFDPRKANQFGNVWRDENHLFRQDVDAYLFHVAIQHGCDAMQSTRVQEIDIDTSGAQIHTSTGEKLTARFVVDATGPNSPLARQYELRDVPTRLRSHSRSLFTHMVNVAPFEACVENYHANGWSLGTLHHIFEGGWIWVIPFNNWEGSTNPLISVGLTLDPNVYPIDEGLSPQAEFELFLNRLPSVARQFEQAATVRPWVHAPRLQYSSMPSVGARYCLMSNSAGFIDPLFSRGLISTVEVIRALIPPLCEALDQNAFSQAQFDAVEVVQQRTLTYHDKLVYGSYVSWRDYEVWNAWLRPWALGLHALESRLGSRLIMGEQSRFKLAEEPMASPYEPPGVRTFFESAFQVIDRYGQDLITSHDAAAQLWQIIQSYEFEIPLNDPSLRGHEWALTSPSNRNLFLGIKSLHEQWEQRLPDAYLEQVGNLMTA